MDHRDAHIQQADSSYVVPERRARGSVDNASQRSTVMHRQASQELPPSTALREIKLLAVNLLGWVGGS
ncbi:hypothetical protein [Streptomyces sp. NPDC055709]